LVCLVCRTDKDIDIDHVQNRGMGGSKMRDVPTNKVSLCRECHTAKTHGVLETRLRSVGTLGLDLETGATSYESLWYEWRRKDADASWIPVPVEVSKRYGCLVLSAAAEEESRDLPASASTSAAALSIGHKEESDDSQRSRNLGNRGVGTDGADGDASGWRPPVGEDDSRASVRHSGGRDSGDSNIPETLTHDQRAAIAAGIKEMEWGRQWLAGDTANEWEEELGEEFWNTWANELGYTYPSLRNNQRVCAAIPPNIRRSWYLRFGHHVVVYDLNREDMEMWLDRCVEEGWSVAEFRRQVKGGRPRVKRWTLEELRHKVDDLFSPTTHSIAGGKIHHFLDWLGERA